jgi:hypothetical protein
MAACHIFGRSEESREANSFLMSDRPKRPFRLLEPKTRHRLFKSRCRHTRITDYPLVGVGKHLIYHRFTFTEMDGHLWSAPGAAGVAKIIRMPAPTHKRFGQEIAGSKKHCPKCGWFVFGIKTDPEWREIPEDFGAIRGGRAARTTSTKEVCALRQAS